MRASTPIALLLFIYFLFSTTFSSVQATELTYRLKWLFNASVAGDIYAEEMGYFEQAGLTVTIKEGGPGKNGIRELELGQADFAVASADQVILALEKGAEVVVLFQIFQVNPMQWIYRDTLPPITDLAQLKGKSIGVTFGGNDESIMNTLFAKGGIKRKDVTLEGARFDFTPFLTGEVQIWPVYRNSQGVILQKRLQAEGEDVRFLNPSAFGVNFVANSVVTSKKNFTTRPEIVHAFQSTLQKAWTEAMDPANLDKTVAAVAPRDKGNSEEIIRLQLIATEELVAAEQFGTIDKKGWLQTEKIMLQEGLIKKPVNIENWLIKHP